MGCLAQVIPERVPAEGAACVWGVQIRGGPEVDAASGFTRESTATEPFEILFFNSGGTGAQPDLNGLSATGFPSGTDEGS